MEDEEQKTQLTQYKYGKVHTYIIDTFQDFLIAEHMKPRMHILE